MNNTEPIIYNVTTMVSNTIVPAWIEWMQQQHIPAVMATNCFTHHDKHLLPNILLHQTNNTNSMYSNLLLHCVLKL
jgi:hypothetical protein